VFFDEIFLFGEFRLTVVKLLDFSFFISAADFVLSDDVVAGESIVLLFVSGILEETFGTKDV
jgi:hypothetical protein